MKNFLKKDYSKTRKIMICLGILLIPYASFYAYTFPLRLKESYRRDVEVNFVYKGKEYKIERTSISLNRGVNINEGHLRFYTDWDHGRKDGIVFTDDLSDAIDLEDGTKARLWLNFNFPKETTNGDLSICDSTNNEKVIVNAEIKNAERNPKFKFPKENSDEPMFKTLDVKITSVSCAEQKIKNYDRFLPFFIDPQYYHDNGLLAVLLGVVFILLIVPILILYLLIAPIVNLFSNI